jgi:hypothetical protein
LLRSLFTIPLYINKKAYAKQNIGCKYLICYIESMCLSSETQTALGCIPNDPGGFASAIYRWGLGLIGGVAIMAILYGAYLILTSQGNVSAMKKGRSYVIYSIIGVLIAIFAVLFYQLIAVDILQIPGFSK